MMILICIPAVIVSILLISYLAYRKAFHMSGRQRSRTFAMPGSEQYERVKEQTGALYREMAALEFEQVYITSFDGLRLAARYYHLSDGAPLQIQFHGYRGSATRDFCGGHKLARACGHNTLVIDQRAHGLSEGHTIAFGILERLDCLSWVNYAVSRFGSEIPIFLSGVSMGAATVLMASELDLPENVRGVMADSPYSSPEAIIRKVCRDMHLPPKAAFPFVRLGARIFGRFDISAASAVQAVQRAKVPVLIIHGEDDRFVPPEMGREISRMCTSPCTFASFPDAGHGLSMIIDPNRYTALTKEFIQKCSKPHPAPKIRPDSQ